MDEWMREVETQIRRLKGQLSTTTEVPVGGVIYYPAAGLADFDEPGWLRVDGSTFNDTPDDGDGDGADDDYADLADALGSTTLPTQASFAPPTGWVLLIRAE
jgi:hypothetical protein